MDFGSKISEADIKKGLRELNPDIVFDFAGKNGIIHPTIDRWQGIFHNQRHVGTMSRGKNTGGLIPEYNVYEEIDEYSHEEIAPGKLIAVKKRGRGRAVEIGWRHTFEKLVRSRIPGITWDALCEKFNVDYKHFRGAAIELDPSNYEHRAFMQ